MIQPFFAELPRPLERASKIFEIGLSAIIAHKTERSNSVMASQFEVSIHLISTSLQRGGNEQTNNH
jgi:hypothetical protein